MVTLTGDARGAYFGVVGGSRRRKVAEGDNEAARGGKNCSPKIN